jgi:hypothetical protein
MNKRHFAEASSSEYGEDAMGHDMGMISAGTSGGQLRNNKKEVQLAKKKLKQLQQKAAANVNVNGLSSSLAFTPVQGIELLNPHAAADKVRQEHCKRQERRTTAKARAARLLPSPLACCHHRRTPTTRCARTNPNPNPYPKVRDANKKYFGGGGGFSKVGQ